MVEKELFKFKIENLELHAKLRGFSVKTITQFDIVVFASIFVRSACFCLRYECDEFDA